MKLTDFFPAPPTWGRAKTPTPTPYCVIASRLDRRELVGVLGPWFDWRIITFTVYADVKADVVTGAALILALFNRNLGTANNPTLVYPSGSRFMSWQQQGEVVIEEDKDTARGKDQWKGTLEGRVWSLRAL